MQGISSGSWRELHAWFSDDAVVEYPFALPSPARLAGNMVVNETLDPEVVVAEWDYDGLVTTTGHAFRVSNITVTTVRNGKIVASRDYHNHAILAGVVGRLPALVETFTKNTAV